MTVEAEICIVDDDADVLDSLQALMRAQGFAVEGYGSAETFLSAVEAGAQPSCIISDVRLTGMSGLDLQQQLIARRVRAPLILMTGHGDITMAVNAIKAGAHDFLEKPFDTAALTAAVDGALDKASRQQQADRSREVIAERIGQLSQRQREVMDLVVQGYSSKEIAIQLGISPRTVETYRLWIMEKTGARNLAELVRMVMQVEEAK
jgi:two-component system response regulator FixJ